MPNDLTPFAFLYASGCVAAGLSVILRLTLGHSFAIRLTTAFALLLFVGVYLVGMSRIGGVDFENYSDAFTGQGQQIPDIGYATATGLVKAAGFEFPFFLLLQGLFTIFALISAARSQRADVVVAVGVYLVHLAIVRDMSQSRIGLAVAIFLLGLSADRRSLKIAIYLIAMSVHLTTAVLILMWIFSIKASKAKDVLSITGFMIVIVMIGAEGSRLIDLLSIIDPRVNFYILLDEEGYGAPLSSFASLIRVAPLILAYALYFRATRDTKILPYIYLELAGAAILIGFADYSIFAARLSNLAASLYPLGIGIVTQGIRRRKIRKHKLSLFGSIALITVTLLVVILRPGSLEALLLVQPTLFE